MKGLLAVLSGGGNAGVAVGLPAGQNMVEGTEASLMVGAAAANSSWRRATVTTIAAFVTLAPIIAGLWFLYQNVPGQYVDYAVAIAIFVIGVREVREGLEGRPRGERSPRHRLDGPLGIDPADPAKIKAFQSGHGLETDGVIGPRTRGAILAELHRRGEQPRPNRLNVEITDAGSVAAFQRHVGLEPDGIVGPRTSGALALEGRRPLPDPADPESVRAFQRAHQLPETAIVDARTQGALRIVRESLDGSGADANAAGARWPERGPGDAYGIDLTTRKGITRFQREHGLDESGVVDEVTQGALRAEIEHRHRRLGVDATDPVSVGQFQAVHGLTTTGVVDEPTQGSMRAEEERLAATNAEQRQLLGVDPTDRSSIERLQAAYGLEQSGEIDERTQEALRRTTEWLAGIDPADPASVTCFQGARGLDATGEVDAETQGALRLYRTELEEHHGEGAPVPSPPWYPLDPTDPGSIRRFQHDHALRQTGTVDRPTQAALREVVTERRRQAIHEAQRPKGGGLIDKYRDAWPAYFGVILEGSEAGMFTIGVAHGRGSYMVAAIAGGAAFATPWIGLVPLRSWLASRPTWVFELVIGSILVTAATIFGLFRATGVFGA